MLPSRKADQEIAEILLALYCTGQQTTDLELTDMGQAARVIDLIRSAREARGEKIVGRKIGFSNRKIWPIYGVDRPMWNYIWNSTVIEISDVRANFELAGLPEPRIEPEIVFRLGKDVHPHMNAMEILQCVDTIAHGFDIVTSIFPNWKVSAAGAAAAYGLHGGLVVGPWRSVNGMRVEDLANLYVTLFKNGEFVEAGKGRNVLDGPITAMKYLAQTIGEDPVAQPLQAGEIVTTGTLTDAQPIEPGDRWSTMFNGEELSGLTVQFS